MRNYNEYKILTIKGISIPEQILHIDDRTILAHTLVALHGLLHAAQAGAHTTGHLVLQRNLALHISLLGITRHTHHHGLRTTGADHVEMLVLKDGMVGNKTLLASTAVLGGDAHSAILGKLVQLEQVGCCTGSQEEHGVGTLILQQLAEVEQRSHTYATAHQQIALARSRWHGETIAKRQHTVEHIALLELGQLTGSVADNSHKKPQLILLTVYKVDGDRTAKHRGRRMVYTYFHKLSWQDFGERLVVGQLNQHVLVAQWFYRNHLEV